MNPRSAGFGLIEILVTVLVFSIGILGVAGLQAVARKNTYEALQRTTAAWLAQSIISSMRANPQALDDYAFSWKVVETTSASKKIQAEQNRTVNIPGDAVLGQGKAFDFEQTKNCFVEACAPERLAAFDLALWARALQGLGETAPVSSDAGQQTTVATGGLSSPTACIFGPGGSGIYTVVIAWRGVVERDDAGAHPCGRDSGFYGAPGASGGASYQRALVVKTFIGAPS